MRPDDALTVLLSSIVSAAQLDATILEWAASSPSPFDDGTLPANRTKGYLTTPEVYERLTTLVECGDLESDEIASGEDVLFSLEDVDGALRGLYDRQQQHLEPLGILSRQLMGIGRLWRIVPPAPDDAALGATQSGVAHILYRFVNAEDAAARATIASELLDAVGDVKSLGDLLAAIATAAAPLPDSSIDVQLLITAANDAINEAADSDDRGPSTPAPGAPAGRAGRRQRVDPTRHSPTRRSAASTSSGEEEDDVARQDGEAVDGLRQQLGQLLRKVLAQLLANESDEDEQLALRAQRENVLAFACNEMARLQRAQVRLHAQVGRLALTCPSPPVVPRSCRNQRLPSAPI